MALIGLPDELICNIIRFINTSDLAALGTTCSILNRFKVDEINKIKKAYTQWKSAIFNTNKIIINMNYYICDLPVSSVSERMVNNKIVCYCCENITFDGMKFSALVIIDGKITVSSDMLDNSLIDNRLCDKVKTYDQTSNYMIKICNGSGVNMFGGSDDNVKFIYLIDSLAVRKY